MKKIAVLGLVLLAAGCSTMDVKVSWQQVENDCVYTEEAGHSSYKITGKREFDAVVTKTITYPGMKCTKIVEGELASGINKNQSVSISKQSFWTSK